MRPLTIVNGILLGSSFALSLGLFVVWAISMLLRPGHPELGDNTGALTEGSLTFAVVAAVAAVSFVGQLRRRPWRGWAFGALLLAITGALSLTL